MGKKILDSKALYIILSVILAVFLWFYVTSLDGNEDTASIRNIPVTFTGVDTLEERGLMIVSETPTASVTVKAAPLVLAKLTDKTVSLVVDVSRITEASEYTLAYTVVLPNDVNPSQVSFVNGETGNVTFTVARYTSHEVEVRGVYAGTTAEGFLAGNNNEFMFSPGTITVSGQADLVNQVAYAQVTVTGEELTESIAEELPFELIGVSGDVLSDLDVTCSVDAVYTYFPILATAEIPLKINFVAGGGLSESRMRCTLSTNSITVAGSAAAVEAIREEGAITLATLNLADVRDGDVFTYPIPLTDELTNISGVTEVTATISVNSTLSVKQFEVSNISYIGLPDEWKAEIITQVLSVEVRGSASLVSELTEENIRVVADLSEVNMAPGQYTVPATVYLDSVGTVDQIGVVGTDYKIVVTLSRS